MANDVVKVYCTGWPIFSTLDIFGSSHAEHSRSFVSPKSASDDFRRDIHSANSSTGSHIDTVGRRRIKTGKWLCTCGVYVTRSHTKGVSKKTLMWDRTTAHNKSDAAMIESEPRAHDAHRNHR